MPGVNKELGKTLKACRVLNGLTQKEVAMVCGVSTPTVQQWESGRRQPRARYMSILARLYDTPVHSLQVPFVNTRSVTESETQLRRVLVGDIVLTLSRLNLDGLRQVLYSAHEAMTNPEFTSTD